jgi:hypothetical protein
MMNLTAQFFISKLELERLQRVRFSVRLLALLVFLIPARMLAMRSSGFSTGPSLCLFRNITGLPCPFCGSTRSVGHILQGEFSAALFSNPLGYFGLAFLILLFVSPARIKSASSSVAQKWWTLTQRNQIVITVGLILLAWVVNTPRLL